MNTLQELNNYSNTQIPFEDDRSLIITVGNTTTTTQSVTVAEDAPVDLSTFGVTFSELRSLDEATADHITLTFDFSAATNPTVIWPDKTAYVEGNTRYNNITFSNPSTGVFVADNIQLNTDYLAVLANTDIIARDQSAVYSYTITVSWPGNSYTQQFDVTTAPAGDETNLNGLALTARSLFQHLLFDPSLTPAPAIVDASPNSTYSLQLTSTLGATLSATLGGTPTTSITLTGDKDTLTTAIQTVYYTPIAGAWNTTDTLNYTLEVTNGTAGVYTSETGSFTNYIPIFASISGITSTTTNSSAEVDLFAAPYPTITSNITSNLIYINITTTYGEVKESSTTGSWGNSLVLTGNISSLETQLQGVQYRPDIDPANPTKTDILSYTMTYQSFNLDSGSWNKRTTIDTVVSNMTGSTVSDIGVADLFSAPLPTVTSTDTNTQYDLTWNYNAGRASISPNIIGSPSTIQTGLQAATFEPLVQDTTVNVTWTLTLRGVVWQTGTFAKAIDKFFTLNNMPSSITFTTLQEYAIFSDVVSPTLIDNIGNGYTLAFTLDASGEATPGSFNSGSGSSVTYTGVDTAITSNLDTTSYLAQEYFTPTTESIAYSLVYNGITWISGTINFNIPNVVNFFSVNNVPTSITFPDQNDYGIFTGIIPITISDTTGNYNQLQFTLDASGEAFPGNFNSGSGSSVTYTGYTSPTGVDPDINGLIAATTYDPSNYFTPQTETIAWNLVYNSQTIYSGTLDFVIPRQIEMLNFTDPGYTSHEYNTQLFNSTIKDNLDPNRTLTLNVAVTSTDTKVFDSTSTFPYPTTLTYSGTQAQINAYLQTIGVVPDPTTNAFDIEFEIVYNTNVLNSTTVTVNKTADGAFKNFDQIYTTDFTITDEMYYFGKLDAVVASAGGGAGWNPPLDTNSGSGGGSDGLFLDAYVDLIDLPSSTVDFKISPGTATQSDPVNTMQTGYAGGDSELSIGPAGGPYTTLYRVTGGGGGGSATWYPPPAPQSGVLLAEDGATPGGGGAVNGNLYGLGDPVPPTTPNYAALFTVAYGNYRTRLAGQGLTGTPFNNTGGDGALNNPAAITNANPEWNGKGLTYVRGGDETYPTANGWSGVYTYGEDGYIKARIRAR